MRFRRFLETEDQSYVYRGVHVTITEMPVAYHETVLLESADPELLNFIRTRVGHFAQRVASLSRGSTSAALAVPDHPPDPPTPGDTLPAVEPSDPPAPGIDPLMEKPPEEEEDAVEYEPQKKFRVVLRYPKTIEAKKLGRYEPDVMYVYAKSKTDAKKRAEMFIRTKLEPVENNEGEGRTRFPKNNFLKDIDRKHMDTNVDQVKNWSQLVQMIRYISATKGVLTPLQYLDEPEFKILLKQAKKKSFPEDVATLNKKEQRLLKTFYFHMAQSPWLSRDTKAMLDDSLTKGMKQIGRDRTAGADDEEYVDPALQKPRHDDDWDSWSIFEPKTPEEEDEIWRSINSIPDVFKAAARYGIKPRQLRDVKDSMFASENEQNEMLRMFWKELRKDLYVKKGLSHRNRIFWDSDYSDERLAKKYDVHWDELSHHYWKYGATSGARIPVQYNDDPDSTKGSDEAQEWLWDFYRQGMPPKPDSLKQWKTAFDHLITYRRKIMQRRKARSEDDYVPF